MEYAEKVNWLKKRKCYEHDGHLELFHIDEDAHRFNDLIVYFGHWAFTVHDLEESKINRNTIKIKDHYFKCLQVVTSNDN